MAKRKSEVIPGLKGEARKDNAPRGKWKTLEGGGAVSVTLKRPKPGSKLPTVASVEGILLGFQKTINRAEPHKEPRPYPKIIIDGRPTLCFMGIDGVSKLQGASEGAYVRVTATRETIDTGMPSPMAVYTVEMMSDEEDS